jgi:N-formylglutamate deformylase
MNPVAITPPQCPLILAMPHSGTNVPDALFSRLNAAGQTLMDTDWHLPQLYAELLPEAGIVQAQFHRYVIDANRDPADVSLYPGQNTTSLCPTTNFDGAPIWRDGCAPTPTDIAERRQQFHQPYHAALQAMLTETKQRFGFALLYDCHSIRSALPFLFEGTLPTLNIGTFDGASCAPIIADTALRRCAASGYSSVLNGRFKGGWTTRHYGQPHAHIHAIQMEITQSAYMREAPPWDYLPQKAASLRAVLKSLLSELSRLTL